MKKLAITMGDAGGVGPEISLKAALWVNKTRKAKALIIGDKGVLKEAADMLALSVEDLEIHEPAQVRNYKKGAPTPESGRASVEYIKYAVKGCLTGDFHAMVTAPISKEALHMAGLKWPGHTELLAHLTKTRDYAMMLVGGPLRVLLVTTHIPLKDVPSSITKELLLRKFILSTKAAKMLGIENPRIGVAGLNPHAGEGGILGREEIETIVPAIQEAHSRGIKLIGPIPPDIIFRKAYKGEVDIVISMYHDQGLGPLKMIAFDKGVNITIGLPIIRTSPDHGTAYDIAWKKKADPSSMIEACRIALKMKN